MTPEQILAKIDELIGPPEDETDEEHRRRIEQVRRHAEARVIRKQSR